MPTLCVITQVFPPEIGAAAGRMFELAQHLSKRGWQVEVLTALPNYPTGQVFDGYDRTCTCVETLGSVRAFRVPLFTSNSSFLGRLRCYLSFVRSACYWGPRLCRKPDIIYVQSPPLFSGLAALYLSWRWRCRYVLNVSDLWPDSGVRLGALKPGLLTGMASLLERLLYKSSAGLTCQTAGIAATLRDRSPESPIEVIINGIEVARFWTTPRGILDRDESAARYPPTFLYAGLLGVAQRLEQLVDISDLLGKEVPGRIVIVGDGPCRSQLLDRIALTASKRVFVQDPVPRESVPALLAAADVAVVSLGYSIPEAVPSKIYEAMASGLPLLLIADGECARLVERVCCGLVVAPGDTQAGVRAFEMLASDADLRQRMGEAGRRYAEANLDRNLQADLLDRFLRARVQ